MPNLSNFINTSNGVFTITTQSNVNANDIVILTNNNTIRSVNTGLPLAMENYAGGIYLGGPNTTPYSESNGTSTFIGGYGNAYDNTGEAICILTTNNTAIPFGNSSASWVNVYYPNGAFYTTTGALPMTACTTPQITVGAGSNGSFIVTGVYGTNVTAVFCYANGVVANSSASAFNAPFITGSGFAITNIPQGSVKIISNTATGTFVTLVSNTNSIVAMDVSTWNGSTTSVSRVTTKTAFSMAVGAPCFGGCATSNNNFFLYGIANGSSTIYTTLYSGNTGAAVASNSYTTFPVVVADHTRKNGANVCALEINGQFVVPVGNSASNRFGLVWVTPTMTTVASNVSWTNTNLPAGRNEIFAIDTNNVLVMNYSLNNTFIGLTKVNINGTSANITSSATIQLANSANGAFPNSYFSTTIRTVDYYGPQNLLVLGAVANAGSANTSNVGLKFINTASFTVYGGVDVATYTNTQPSSTSGPYTTIMSRMIPDQGLMVTFSSASTGAASSWWGNLDIKTVKYQPSSILGVALATVANGSQVNVGTSGTYQFNGALTPYSWDSRSANVVGCAGVVVGNTVYLKGLI